MKRIIRKRKCKHCHSLFLPDPRNVKRQQYCSKPECRKASKAQSQRNWLTQKLQLKSLECAEEVPLARR